MAKPYLSIIIPAHNEEKRLPTSLEKLKQFCAAQPYASEVLVVENASSDNTLAVARAYQAQLPGLRVISLDEPGKGGAVRAGMLAAEGVYRFMADADFSMPVEEINRFLPPALPDCDVAIGSREVAGARRIGEPFYRHLIGRVFNGMVRLAALPGIQDSQCGFKCFRAEAAQAVFSRQRMTGWSFDVEVLALARTLGFSIREVPVTWVYDPGSRVNVLRDSALMARDLWRVRRALKRGVYRDPPL